jgi:hypothetical protein
MEASVGLHLLAREELRRLRYALRSASHAWAVRGLGTLGDIPAPRLMGLFWGPSIGTVGTSPLGGVSLLASMRSINSCRTLRDQSAIVVSSLRHRTQRRFKILEQASGECIFRILWNLQSIGIGRWTPSQSSNPGQGCYLWGKMMVRPHS